MSCSCHEHEKEHQVNPISKSKKERSIKREFIFDISRIIVSSLLTGLYFVDYGYRWISVTLVSLAYVIIGYDTFIKMIKGFKHRNFFNENFLMAIATFGAMFIGEYYEATLVLILYHIGEMFEEYATNKANKSIIGLINKIPLLAHKVEDKQIKECEPEEIAVGDILEIRPGERVALDGVMITNYASLDQSSLTGESTPVSILEGQEVYSGSINLDVTFRMRVTRLFSNSTLSNIMKLITSEENKRGNNEKFITRFSKIYTPIVCLSALVVFIVLLAINGFSDYKDPLYSVINIIIISCPCSLVISIPLSFYIGIGRASKMGVLVKGGLALENLKRSSVICFDKTGTLTEGKFVIEEIDSVSDENMRLAASLEVNISHPIGKVYVDAAKSRGLDLLAVSDFINIPGLGIEGIMEGKKYQIGSAKLLQKNQIQSEVIDTPFLINYLVESNKVIAIFILKDKIKDSSKAAITKLKLDGVKQLIMLSGDDEKICQSVANSTGITNYHSSLMPDQKLAKVKEFKENEIVAFVGDGINDSPSLIAADLGIAMGGLGSEAAIDSADVVIMNDDLGKIPKLRRLSKKVMVLIIENIVTVLLFKTTVMALSAFGYSNMILSIIGDVGIMVLAVLNTLRINIPDRQTRSEERRKKVSQ